MESLIVLIECTEEVARLCASLYLLYFTGFSSPRLISFGNNWFWVPVCVFGRFFFFTLKYFFKKKACVLWVPHSYKASEFPVRQVFV